MMHTQVPEYSFPSRSNKKKRSESLENMNNTENSPHASPIPKTHDLQQYLQSHAVEPILTSLLEHICFNRPENVPQAMIQFLQTKYPSTLPTRPTSVNRSTYSLTIEPATSHNLNGRTSATTAPAATVTNINQRPSSAQSTSSKDSADSTQDKKAPFSWLQKGKNGSPIPGPNDSFYTFDNETSEIDFHESENRRRRYSISVPLRRGGVFSESVDVKEAQNFKRVVIPKSDEEMKRIKDSSNGINLFKALDQDAKKALFDAMFKKECKAGESVIKQGDEGDNFYIVDSGDLEIFVQDPTTKEQKKVQSVGPGGTFGELALMFNTPRAATVIAKTDCKLWAIDRVSYRKIVMAQTIHKRSMYEEFLKNVHILKNLLDYERLTIADALKPCEFKAGAVIVRQGEPGDDFYIIEEGQCVVKKSNGTEEQELVRLHKADYFGELALLYNQPRAATVQAVSDVRAVSLDRRSFKMLLGGLEDILKRNASEKY